MKSFIVRSSGWSEPLSREELEGYCADLFGRLRKVTSPTLKITYRPEKSDLTQAEIFGKYVRELHAVYSLILDEMKSTRKWIAMQIRSTEHSLSSDVDAYVLTSDEPAVQIQVRGRAFDPLVFNFPWEDNSMSHPWKPWNWQISILPEDLDEKQYFLDLKSQRLIVGQLFSDRATIELFSLSLRLPEGLHSFRAE